jgi:hypothetical protein
MSTYQPATAHSDAIERPTCSQCGTKTRLIGIEADSPGHELHTFGCPKCQHVEAKLAKID